MNNVLVVQVCKPKKNFSYVCTISSTTSLVYHHLQLHPLVVDGFKDTTMFYDVFVVWITSRYAHYLCGLTIVGVMSNQVLDSSP